MDVQSLINIGFAAFSAGVGWFAREMWSAVKVLKDDLSKLREEIANDRVHKDDFRDAMREIKEMLTKIFDKLDGKVDKP